MRNTSRIRRFAAGLGALCLAGCSPSQLVAEQLVLTDPEGQPRVFLGTTERGTGLLIYDAKGKVRAGLNLVDDASELSLADGQGTLRVVLAQRGERATLTLVGAGTTRADLAVEAQGGKLTLVDPAGRAVSSPP